MEKHITFLLFLSLFPLCAQAEHVCAEWVTYTQSNGKMNTSCLWWKEFDSSSAKTQTSAEPQTTKASMKNPPEQRVLPVKEPLRPYACQVWKTAILKNGSRQSHCAEWKYLDKPSPQRLICREFVSKLLSETLVKKQKRAWRSECSQMDTEENGKFCLLWKHEYRPDGTIISRCSQYQQDKEAGLFVSKWTDYIGPDSDLKPVASIADYFALDERYPCQEYTGSKMDKKQGSYKVTCTQFATPATLPQPQESAQK